MRPNLSEEAIRLARLLIELLPEPEVAGLLALMLLHDSRRAARISPQGDLVLLEDQDRSLWNRAQIAEGKGLVETSLLSRRFGPYTVQAAIAGNFSIEVDIQLSADGEAMVHHDHALGRLTEATGPVVAKY